MGKIRSDSYDQVLDSFMTLLLQYRYSRISATFMCIVRGLDGWIITIIRRLKKQWGYLREVDSNELYQTAIVGVAKAFNKIPKDENPALLAQWVKAYIVAEIRKTYSHQGFEIPASQLIAEYEDIEVLLVRKGMFSEIRRELEGRDLCELLPRLVTLGTITDRELRCLRACYLQDFSHTDIAKLEGLTRSRITQIISGALSKIRRYVIC